VVAGAVGVLTVAALTMTGPVSASAAAGTVVSRIAGADRTATAVAVSRVAFGGQGTGDLAGAAVLASGDGFADGVAGGPLAAAVDGPLLLTGTDSLDPRAAAELTRVLPPGGTVYLLGGPAALSRRVQASVASLGFTATRLQGDDRYGTAVAVARTITSIAPVDTVLLTSGLTFPDALSAGPAAAHVGGAVLLTRGNAMDARTRQYLGSLAPREVVAVGGSAARAAASVASAKIVGTDRYATSAKVADRYFGSVDTMFFASGEDFPDALSAAALGGLVDAPVVLVRRSGPTPDVRSLLTRRSAQTQDAAVIGGRGPVPDGVVRQLQAALGG
jgi:putative cell wall-binding protein